MPRIVPRMVIFLLVTPSPQSIQNPSLSPPTQRIPFEHDPELCLSAAIVDILENSSLRSTSGPRIAGSAMRSSTPGKSQRYKASPGRSLLFGSMLLTSHAHIGFLGRKMATSRSPQSYGIHKKVKFEQRALRRVLPR